MEDNQFSRHSLLLMFAGFACIVLYIMYNHTRATTMTEHFLWDSWDGIHVLYPYSGMPYPGMPTTKPPTKSPIGNASNKPSNSDSIASSSNEPSNSDSIASSSNEPSNSDSIASSSGKSPTTTGNASSSGKSPTTTGNASSSGKSPTTTGNASSSGKLPTTTQTDNSLSDLQQIFQKIYAKPQTPSGSTGNSVDMSAGQWESAIKPNIPSTPSSNKAVPDIKVPILEIKYPYKQPIIFEHNEKCLGVKDGKPWFNSSCDLVEQQKTIVQTMVNSNTFSLQVNGKCLDSNGEEVYLLDCNGGDFQKWSTELKTANEENVSNILHVKSRKCLDANAEGRVYMGPCGIENGFQKFRYRFVAEQRKTLDAGQSLTGADNVLMSVNHAFAAVLQQDGNFVVYRISKPLLTPGDMIPSNSIFSTGTYERFIEEEFAEQKITWTTLLEAAKIDANPDPTNYVLKLEKTGELKIITPESKTLLVLFKGGTSEGKYQLRFGLDKYVHRLELHNQSDNTIPWTSENMQVNPTFVQLTSAKGETVTRQGQPSGTKYNTPTMFYVNHEGKLFFAIKNNFVTIKFNGDNKVIEYTDYEKDSLLEACFTDMVVSIDWNKEFYVVNFRYIYMVDSGKVTRIDPGVFTNIVSISVNKAGNNLAIIADNVGPDFGRKHRNTVFLWFLESWDGYGPGWYYIRKDGYAIYPVKDNNNNNEFEFQFRVTNVDIDEDGFNDKDLFRKLIFCGDDPGLYTTNLGYKKRYKIEEDMDLNQRYGGRTAMFVGEGTVLKELVRNEWKDGDKTIRLNCLFTASRNHYTIVVCTGYDIMIYYSKYVGSGGMGEFVKELAIYVGIELLTLGIMAAAGPILTAMRATATWGRTVSLAASALQRISSSGVMTSVRSIGASTSQFCKQIAAPLKTLTEKSSEMARKYIGTSDDFLRLAGELKEEILTMGIGMSLETAWDKIYDKATSDGNPMHDVEEIKHAVASQYQKMVYFRYVTKYGTVFSIVDSTDQNISEQFHNGIIKKIKSQFTSMNQLYNKENVDLTEKTSDEAEEKAKNAVLQAMPSSNQNTQQSNRREDFTQQTDDVKGQGFTKSSHSTLKEAFEDDPNNYDVDKSEGAHNYKDVNIYELYATTFSKSGDENIDKRMRRNDIRMNEIKNIVSSKDTEQNFIFMQGDYDIYLCYRTEDRMYNMMQIFRSTNPIVSIGCDIDGQRVFFLKANGLIYSARNSSSTKRDGNRAIIAVDQPKYNFEAC